MKNKLFTILCAATLFGCSVESPNSIVEDNDDDPNVDEPRSVWQPESNSGGSICSLYENTSYNELGIIELPPFCNPYYMEKGRPPEVEKSSMENNANPVDKSKNPIMEKVVSDNFS